MNHTHTLAEWAAFLFLGLGLSAAASIPFWLADDAALADFDPRPAFRRVVESEALYVLLREWDIARYSFRESCRDLAALLILLCTSPKGART